MGRFEIILVLALLFIGSEGGKRTLTLSELLQLKEGGLPLDEYNSVEGLKPSDEPPAQNKRKPKCFGSSSGSQVPFQTWGMDPRVENSTSTSDSPPNATSDSSTPSYYYSGPILSTPILS